MSLSCQDVIFSKAGMARDLTTLVSPEIFSDNIDDFTISSIGEGRFIIKEMCKIYNINYTPIDNINYNSIVNVDKNKVYSNMTSALVVLNFIKNKNHV